MRRQMTTSSMRAAALVAALVLAFAAPAARAGGVTTTSTTVASTTSTTVTSTTSTVPTTTTSTTTTSSTSTSLAPTTSTSTTSISTTSVSTSTSLTTSTSTSTSSTTSTSNSTTSSTSTSSSTTSSTSTTTLPVPESCGNCLDDDGNGLTDFEDPACCGDTAPAVTTIELLRLLPGVAASRLNLSLAPLPVVAAVSPATHTVFVQLVPDDGAPAFCASVDAVHFRAKGSKASFRDTTLGVPSAAGLSSVKLRRLASGNTRLTLGGVAVAIPTPDATRIRIGVALRALTEVGAPTRCVGRTVTVVQTKQGALVFP